MKLMLLVACGGALGACASGDTNQPTGPVQLVNVALQPARIAPHANGALLLSAATGCLVEFVGRVEGEPVYRFRIAPTQRMPDIDRCLASLRTQPGVTAVEPVR